jgi:plasmid stabilization system protein ParE
MSLPLVFQAGARDEIDDAYEWYEQQRPGLGEELLSEAQSVLDRIGQNPEIYAPIYQSVRRGRVKRFPYAVYYSIEPERVAVIAFYHDKRDPRGWQSKAGRSD